MSGRIQWRKALPRCSWRRTVINWC